MQMSSSMVLIAWFLLTMLSLESIFAAEDSENMGRPTRPKVFTNVDELKEYLELVKDYYALKAKPRYGKRAENVENVIDPSAYTRESFRLKLNIVQHLIQGIEAVKQNEKQHQRFLRDRYPEENNKLSKFVQLGGIKLS